MALKEAGGMLLALIIGSQLLLLPLQATPALAESKVTITVAVGGVACGAFFFLRFAFGSSMTIDHVPEGTDALLNFDPEGWRIRLPVLQLTGNENPQGGFPGFSPETLRVNIVQYRF